jgi:hypothetical protein
MRSFKSTRGFEDLTEHQPSTSNSTRIIGVELGSEAEGNDFCNNAAHQLLLFDIDYLRASQELSPRFSFYYPCVQQLHPHPNEHTPCSRASHLILLSVEPHLIRAKHLQQTHPLQCLTDGPSLTLLSDEPLRSRASHTQYSIQYPLSIEPTPPTANESNRYSSREASVAPDEPNHLTPTDPLSREPALLLRTSRILHPLLRATPTATEPDRVHIPLAMIAHA